MPLSIQCPNPTCKRTALAPNEFEGRAVRCKHCGQAFVAGATADYSHQPTETGEFRKKPPTGTAPETRSKLKNTAEPFPELPTEFGRYRVLKLLGRGGMGAVYLAEDSHLGRQVALKIPGLDVAGSPQRAERFVREARAAAALQHPNICTVYDAGQVDGRPYITMAFIEGEPLNDRIDPDAPMSQLEAARIVRKLALALQEAHTLGIVHRDLKPANVMITPEGEPVVMDFGLAKRVLEGQQDEQPLAAESGLAEQMRSSRPNAQDAKLTQDGAVLGTPSYMAPEQVRGEVDRIAPHTDVYALGVILFEMLTGEVPFRGSLGVVMGRILAAPVPPLSEFRSDAEPLLDSLCQRAMAKDPVDRFPSMAAFVAALDVAMPAAAEDTLSSSTDTSRAATTVTRVRPGYDSTDATTELITIDPPKSRSKWVIAGAVALIASLVVAAALLTPGKQIGEVVFELSEPGAKVDVAVDGKRIDVAAGQPFEFEAGEHTLTASGDWFEPETMTFSATAGKRRVVLVVLRHMVRRPSPTPAPKPLPKITPPPVVPATTTPPTQTPANALAGNLAAGREFIKQWEWAKALPLLATTQDVAWQTPAVRELGVFRTPTEKLAVGDAWWALAEKSTGKEQISLRMHAADCYIDGLTGLAPPEREKLIARIKQYRGEPDMSGVKPLHDRDFTDPAQAPRCPKSVVTSGGHANGRFFMRVESKPYSLFSETVTTVPNSFVCSVRGRWTAETLGRWTLLVRDAPKPPVRVYAVGLTHNGIMQPGGRVTAISGGLLNPAGEFNTLTVVVNKQTAEVYLNGGYVLTHHADVFGEGSLVLLLQNTNDKGPAVAEFERLTVWPADNIPPFEDRRRRMLDLAPVPKLPEGVLSPAEAAKKVGEKVTVQFTVASEGGRMNLYLNTNENYQEKDNLAVMLPVQAQTGKWDKASRDTFVGKTIRATGTIKVNKSTSTPQLEIEVPADLEIVEK